MNPDCIDFEDDEFSASCSSSTDGIRSVVIDHNFIRLSRVNGMIKLYVNGFGSWHLVSEYQQNFDFDAVFTNDMIFSSIIVADKDNHVPDFITQKDMEIEDD